MSKVFDSKNNFTHPSAQVYYRAKFKTEAYTENDGLGPKVMKDTHFYERLHYGVIDDQNNSVIPDEQFMVSTKNGRVFDFVADSFSLMKLNYATALRKGLVSNEGSLIGNLDMTTSYTNPKIRYGRHLEGIFQFYNETHIPINLGITSIASYEDYVKNFFKFFFSEGKNLPLTMTRWLVSPRSSILDTGLAFSYADVDYDDDQLKYDNIINHPCFGYIQNLSMNMSFSIVHNNPNIILYDMNSPAGSSIRQSYGLFNLSDIFNNRFIKTYTIDNTLLYNNINIYYNKYVFKNPQIKVVSVQKCKTVSEYIRLQPVNLNKRPYTDTQELWYYIRIRQKEEGDVFSPQKLENIYKKAKYFLKKVDKASAMSYINSMFKDQVWNKNYGFHDALAKIKGQTQTEAQRQQTGGGPSSGGSSY
jgi:hypothetical protein